MSEPAHAPVAECVAGALMRPRGASRRFRAPRPGRSAAMERAVGSIPPIPLAIAGRLLQPFPPEGPEQAGHRRHRMAQERPSAEQYAAERAGLPAPPVDDPDALDSSVQD